MRCECEVLLSMFENHKKDQMMLLCHFRICDRSLIRLRGVHIDGDGLVLIC